MFHTVRRIFVGIILMLGFVQSVYSQDSMTSVFALSGGMGITAINATDVVDYINMATPPASRLDDFSSAAEFFGSAQIRFNDSWGSKLEYAYLINSYNITSGSGSYEYSYVIHMPTLIAQHLDMHAGYAFKFGGGLGYHIALLSERLQGASARDFKSTGLGVKVDAEGNTALGESMYAYLGVDVRVNFMSTFKDSQGNVLQIRGLTPKNAKMNFFALGLKFGMIYYF